MALFEFDNTSLGYNGQAVLRGVSLRIEAGERVALVGPSGVGKSTLLGALHTQRNGGTALVPQDTALVKTLSVYHNVYMGRLDQHGGLYNLANLVRPWRRDVAAIRPILRTLGMEEKIWSPVGELSGGQQQRTGLGRALFQGGEVLLGDEPVSAVDPLQARTLLQAVNDAFPTVILAMHDLQLALEFCNRVVALKDGSVVLDGPADGLTPADLDSIYRR